MGELLNYDSKPYVIAGGVTERRIILAHKVVALRVPARVTASVRFGRADADAIPLQEGWNRFCLTQPPGVMYLTATDGDPIDVLTSQDIVPDFFSPAAAAAIGAQKAAASWFYSWDLTPPNAALGIGGTVKTNVRDRSGSVSNPLIKINNTPDLQIFRDTPAAHMTPPFGAEVWEGLKLDKMAWAGTLLQGSLAAGGDAPTQHVARYIFKVAREAGNAISGVGMFIKLDNDAGAAPNLFNPALTEVGFGVGGDGAGGWLYISKPQTAGSPIFTAPIAWPVPVTEWAVVELRVEGATSTRAARFRILVNGVIVITRLWDGGELPLYSAIAGGVAFHAMIQNANSVALDLDIYCAGIQMIFSEFSPTGD